LLLSRTSKQKVPNFGQRVSTLRSYNDEVKSKWAFLRKIFKVFFPVLREQFSG